MRGKGLHPTERGGARAGFVLIAVLSVTALLGLMLGAGTLLARDAVATAVVEADDLQADALLASGLALAGHQLFVLHLTPSSVNGQQVRMNNGTVTIFVAPEAGKVDLNGADALLLASAYRAAGLTALTPDDFAARVVDWRDEDDAALPGGAEAADYRAGGLAYQPANAPFRAIGDLAWVLGVGPSDVAALAPLLTISNPIGKIDPTFASPRLITALPGMDESRAQALAALPPGDGVERLLLLRAILRGLEREMVLGEALRVFAVRIEARPGRGGPVRTANAVVIASVLSERPFQVTQWREN